MDKNENFVQYCTPRCDIAEDDSAFTLQLHLDNYEENQVQVKYNKKTRVLTMQGERPMLQSEVSSAAAAAQQHMYGPTPSTPNAITQCHKFERTFKVPVNANDEEIEFAFDNAILVVQIPKLVGKKPQH